MKKALMFGTGDSATRLMKNMPNERVYVAAVDNDTDRHGQVFRSLPIIGPEQMGDFDYDEIVIGSYWEGTIKKQLMEDFNIPESKIVTPHKKYVKSDEENQTPFRHAPTLELAKNTVKTLCGKAFEQKLPLHIDYGTLLGILRGGALIEWDDDVDLAADVAYAPEIQAFLLNTVGLIDERVNWQIRRDVDQHGQIILLYLTFQAKPGFSFKPFSVSIALKGFEGDKAVKLKGCGTWYTPAHHLQSVDSIEWEKVQMYIPHDAEGYLTFTYGDWQTPKQEISIGMGNNWQPVSIEKIKNSQFTVETIYDKFETQ
ncbi:LicD family protein [Glaciecola sp. MH2013]|uniref:LicD family protein n=1 Tax=Glaciecola sp. MH2013 TaxID=2785524 RepID=UPI00189DCFC0|nr:LicD family protein [Glaciecola sp. MH2013]MBF7073114.1 LicD family protein [Glaciecola sp. MH2013]